MKRLLVWISLVVVTVSLCACSESATYVPDYDSDYIYEEYEEFEDYESTKEDETNEKTESKPMGPWSLEDVKGLEGTTGFLIHYPDDTFDYYFGGNIVNWGMPEPYTYGTERSVSNLVMYIDTDNANLEKLKNGELVFVTDRETHIVAHIFPVIESGYAMHCYENANGVSEFLLWENETGSKCDYVDNITLTPKRRNIDIINGMTAGEEKIFEKDENNKYVTLNEGDVYTIGEVKGTTLVESEYYVDSVYYLHTYDTDYFLYEYPDEAYPFEMQATTDGYARVDFSGLPAGDYIVMYSYWNEKYEERGAYMAHIVID